jgi:hypothetical protein
MRSFFILDSGTFLWGSTRSLCVHSNLGRLLYHAASEGDDLATLSQGDPLALRGFETLRDIKLNQSRHNEASQDEHLLSPDTLPNQLMGKIPAWVLQQITDKVAKIGLLN